MVVSVTWIARQWKYSPFELLGLCQPMVSAKNALSHKSLPATTSNTILEACARIEDSDNLLISWAMFSTGFSPSDSRYTCTWSGANQSRLTKESTDELLSKKASFTILNAFWGSRNDDLLWTTFQAKWYLISIKTASGSFFIFWTANARWYLNRSDSRIFWKGSVDPFDMHNSSCFDDPTNFSVGVKAKHLNFSGSCTRRFKSHNILSWNAKVWQKVHWPWVIGLEYFLHSWHFLGISIEVGIFSIFEFSKRIGWRKCEKGRFIRGT